jgi:uncharacterized protein YecT (DUF1311 family)
MSTDDYTPDLSKLEQDYQILTELHRSRDSRSYLARHLELNRDVTITVIRRGANDAQSLSRFAGDVERLKSTRHPNVIPVIEGRWLADGSFAVVRARVRGLSLDQLVATTGAMPLARVGGALQQVKSALDWARTNAIANRCVNPDEMIFQQGSGRVLLTLEPARAAGTPDSFEDARTIGRLGWEMLAGESFDAAAVKSLAGLRPDLSPAIVAETETLMRCEPGSKADAASYITMLGGSAMFDTPVTIPVVTADTVPPVTAPTASAAIPAVPAIYPRREPVGATSDAVVVRKTGMSFGARFMTGVAVIAVIAVVAFLFMRRGGASADRVASEQGQTTAEQGGDVAARAGPDTTALARQYTTPVPYQPQPTYSAPASPIASPIAAPIASPIAPPETRRHEPLQTPPPLTMPARPSTIDSVNGTRSSAPDSATTMTVTDICSSPAESDQHKCLMNAIDRNDIALNSVYQQLTAALRRQANVSADDPEPETIGRLRSAEHEWMDQRDQTCHSVGDGPLYARERAQCFATESAKRTREFQQQLDAIPNP